MNAWFLPIFVVFIGILIGCNAEVADNSKTDVFDIQGYLDSRRSDDNMVLENVQLLSSYGEEVDTVLFERYHMDSIYRIILGFDFSRKERAGEFEIERSESGGMSCERYIPETESDIRYLEVCRRNDVVKVLKGSKTSDALLNELDQSYEWNADSSFTLSARFIDKVGGDTVQTVNQITWNVND